MRRLFLQAMILVLAFDPWQDPRVLEDDLAAVLSGMDSQELYEAQMRLMCPLSADVPDWGLLPCPEIWK